MFNVPFHVALPVVRNANGRNPVTDSVKAAEKLIVLKSKTATPPPLFTPVNVVPPVIAGPPNKNQHQFAYRESQYFPGDSVQSGGEPAPVAAV
jgi:hypothetical protein